MSPSKNREMVQMALYGSSIPLDSGETVVTVICPNAYSHSRLMQALNNIVPEAAELVARMTADAQARGEYDPVPEAGTGVPNHGNLEVEPPSYTPAANPVVQPRDPEQEDDTGEAYKVGGAD